MVVVVVAVAVMGRDCFNIPFLSIFLGGGGVGERTNSVIMGVLHVGRLGLTRLFPPRVIFFNHRRFSFLFRSTLILFPIFLVIKNISVSG